MISFSEWINSCYGIDCVEKFKKFPKAFRCIKNEYIKITTSVSRHRDSSLYGTRIYSYLTWVDL